MSLVNKILLFTASMTCFIIGGVLSAYGKELSCYVFALIGVFALFPIFQKMREEQ